MTLKLAKAWLAGMTPGSVVVTCLVLKLSPLAVASHPCDRYALDGLTLGMNPGTVKTSMGGNGLGTSTRLPDGEVSTGVSYPNPAHEIYVEYDQRIDRRKARVVRVRVAMPLSKDTVEGLVGRFGQPNAGADELTNDLRDGGTAVWVDDTCGLVLTAFRQAASWWAAESGAQLQVETFELAQRSDSPARSKLSPAHLATVPRPTVAPQDAPAAPPAPAAVTLEDDLALPEQDQPPAEAMEEAPVTEAEGPPEPLPMAFIPRERPLILVAAAVPAARPRPVNPPEEPEPSAASRTISTWHPTDPPRADAAHLGAPVMPQTITAWRSSQSTKPYAPAERVRYVQPVCPPTAKWLGVKGRVVLGIVVQPDGTVASAVRLINAIPPGRGFEDASIDAVRQWRFTPATRGGRPVSSRLTITVDIE